MHAFNAYTLRVYDKILPGPNGDKYHDLTNVRGANILDHFDAFLGTLKNVPMHVDKKNKKTVHVEDYKRTGNSVYGWLEYGEYGIPGKLFNVNTLAQHDKAHDDSDIVRLYFQIRVPTDSQIGYILFHTAGNKGVKQFFTENFNGYYHEVTAGLTTQIKPISHEESLKEWLDSSSVKEIRLKNVSIMRDGEDVTDKLGTLNTEFTIKPSKKGGTFGSFGLFGDKKLDDGAGFVEVLKEISPDIRTVVSSGKRKKVVRIGGGMPISAIEITEDVVSVVNGVPDEGELHLYANDLIDEFISGGK